MQNTCRKLGTNLRAGLNDMQATMLGRSRVTASPCPSFAIWIAEKDSIYQGHGWTVEPACGSESGGVRGPDEGEADQGVAAEGTPVGAGDNREDVGHRSHGSRSVGAG